MKRIKRLGLFTVLLFLLIATVPMAVFAGVGEFDVGEGPPTISDVTISTTGAPGTNMTDWDLDANTIYYFNYTITTDSTLEIIGSTEVHFWWNESIGDYPGKTLNLTSRYGFTWYDPTEGDPKWGEYGTGNWDWDTEKYYSKSLCTLPSDLTVQSGEWAFAFKFSKVAIHSTDAWNIMIKVKTTGELSEYNRDHTLDVNYYSEILTFYPSIDIGSGNPGATVGPVQGSPSLVTLANDAYKITVSSTAPTNGSYTIPVGNLKIDTDSGLEGAQSLTTDEADWVVCSRDILEAGTTTECHWWIVIPTPQYPGTYTFTYTHTIKQGT